MAQFVLIPFIIVTVSLLIWANLSSRRRHVFLWKPLSTLLVIMVAALALWTPGAYPGYTAGLLVGLTLSLGGDVALMFPSDRAFRLGLGLFLLAHVAYAITLTAFNGFHAADLISGGLLLMVVVLAYRYLAPGLGSIKGPVLAYILVICITINRALSTFSGTFLSPPQAWLVSLGACLFAISDLMLAINRFRRPFRYHHLSLAAYYGGQLLIALSPTFFA